MPKFTAELNDVTAFEAEAVSFECSVWPEEAPVMWYMAGESVEGRERCQTLCAGSKRTLIIRDCQLADVGQVSAVTGQFQCEAMLNVTGRSLLKKLPDFMNVCLNLQVFAQFHNTTFLLK